MLHKNGSCWLQKLQRTHRERITKALKSKFFLVPKPSCLDSQWRLDFHDTEIEIIKDMGCAKPVIKSLKLFRDSNPQLEKLASYCLKTIVMNMIRSNPDDDWKQGTEAEHFLKALNNLLTALERRKISYFFNENSNLLSKLKPSTLTDMANYLKKAIKAMEDSQKTSNCRNVWLKYFNEVTC